MVFTRKDGYFHGLCWFQGGYPTIIIAFFSWYILTRWCRISPINGISLPLWCMGTWMFLCLAESWTRSLPTSGMKSGLSLKWEKHGETIHFHFSHWKSYKGLLCLPFTFGITLHCVHRGTEKNLKPILLRTWPRWILERRPAMNRYRDCQQNSIFTRPAVFTPLHWKRKNLKTKFTSNSQCSNTSFCFGSLFSSSSF